MKNSVCDWPAAPLLSTRPT